MTTRARPPMTRLGTTLCALGALALSLEWIHSPIALAQNVVDGTDEARTAPRVELDAADLERAIWTSPVHARLADPPPATRRVATKLTRHVVDFLAGEPFAPFVVTLGISGHETWFGHPEDLVAALSVAVPYLPPSLAMRVRRLLERQIEVMPPYIAGGFEPSAGTARERYTVPERLRVGAPARARSLYGVHAFWLFVRWCDGVFVLERHWPDIRRRAAAVLDRDYGFDIEARHERDEAEVFAGDLAGIIALARLARWIGDGETETRAVARAKQMLALRIDLERVNPRILEPTKVASTNSLHNARLARYVYLTPAVGGALADLTDGVAASRLAAFRGARNGWFLAFGPRLIGGENYTSSPHLSRALFDAAATIERRPADELLEYVDVPWCRGDFNFIAKCVTALWVEGGRRVETIGER